MNPNQPLSHRNDRELFMHQRGKMTLVAEVKVQFVSKINQKHWKVTMGLRRVKSAASLSMWVCEHGVVRGVEEHNNRKTKLKDNGGDVSLAERERSRLQEVNILI